MSSGTAKGETRVSLAIENALKSPLLNNNDIFKSKRILFNIYYSTEPKPLMTEEMDEIHNFMAKFGSEIEVIWGTAVDESLGENIKITILATGFGTENIPLSSSVLNAKKQLSQAEKEEQERKEEAERIKAEEQREREGGLIKMYYPAVATALTQGGKTTRPDLFIFSLENINDSETVEAIINHPTYSRDPKVLRDINKKTELLRKKTSEEVTDDNKNEYV
jgi:cell division protein FtsZ